MSFLSGFLTTLHVLEAAAQIAGPFIAISDPAVGTLVTQASHAAISIESDMSLSGAQKAAVVAAQTAATLKLVNDARVAQQKPPLPPSVTTAVAEQVTVVVTGLKAISDAAAPATSPV